METPTTRGLSSMQAAERFKQFGPNEIARPHGRNLRRIALDTLREPMFLLLVGAAALYLVLGDVGEGLFLLAGALASIGLVIVQEARSERALSALREIAQPVARVIRDGVEKRLPARDLVPGDILLIGEGERVAADGVRSGLSAPGPSDARRQFAGIVISGADRRAAYGGRRRARTFRRS